MKRFPFLVFAVLVLSWASVFWASASAQSKRQPSPGPKGTPASTTVISPIFGQLVGFSLPANFKVVREDSNAQAYIREAVPAGETVQRWTQMITVTGHKGMTANYPALTPQGFAEVLAGEFKKSCPETYSASPLGDGPETSMFIAACGNLKANLKVYGGEHSEMAVIIVIKGATDYYTLQWAERGRAMDSVPKLDDAKWKQRAEALQPIRLCAIVPGEKPPYPSCLNEK